MLYLITGGRGLSIDMRRFLKKRLADQGTVLVTCCNAVIQTLYYLQLLLVILIITLKISHFIMGLTN